jgi:outer membrane biosynthesis protein TonB
MATRSSRSILLPLGILAASTLASCSLPPGEAWRQIQTRGLIPYVASEMRGDFDANRPASPTPVINTTPDGRTALATNTRPTPAAPERIVGPTRPSVTPSPTPASVPPPSQLSAATLPQAKTVEGLPGYVRSPFTNPPRLVDVRGMNAGSKVVCPYTRKPFLVPAGAQGSAPAPNMAANTLPSPAPAPVPTPTVAPTPAPTPTPAPKVMQTPPSAPTKVAANTANSAPAPSAPPSNSAPKQEPAASPPSAPAASEIPFGSVVSGRPGFVNSPFAAKHQLVDVTGLPTGMEVKCPYTGKLFRVPPQANKAQ